MTASQLRHATATVRRWHPTTTRQASYAAETTASQWWHATATISRQHTTTTRWVLSTTAAGTTAAATRVDEQ